MKIIKKTFLSIWRFLKEVYTELRKVVWLSKKQTIDYTFVVIFLCLVTAVFVGGLDFLFTYLMNKIII
ncbi:MAG: preprotein translocase subunit SecE [bacterium]